MRDAQRPVIGQHLRALLTTAFVRGAACGALALALPLAACEDTPVGDGDHADEEAAFMASAVLTVLVDTDTQFGVQATFPNRMESEIVFSLTRDVPYADNGAHPGEEGPTYNATLAYEDVTRDDFGVVDGFSYTLSYFVPYTELPADFAAGVGHQPLTDGENGVQVVGKGVVKSAGKKAVEAMLKKGLGKNAGGAVAKAGGGMMDVMSAWQTNREHWDWLDRLDALEACVKNPLNPLTQQAYAQDPALRQQHLDKIAATRQELKDNTGVRFFNQAVSTASSLIPGTKALWPVISGAKSYTEDTLKKVSAWIVDALEKELPKCTDSYSGWLHLRTTMDDGDYEQVNVVNLDDTSWELQNYGAGDLATYGTSAGARVEVILRGSSWEESCDPVDQFVDGVAFTGVMVVYASMRSDSFDDRYAWAIAPTEAVVNVTAKCDTDGDPDTPRVDTPRPVGLFSHFSSCGYATAPSYDPWGTPGDMPMYLSASTLAGSGSWPCEYMTHHAEWSLAQGM